MLMTFFFLNMLLMRPTKSVFFVCFRELLELRLLIFTIILLALNGAGSNLVKEEKEERIKAFL